MLQPELLMKNRKTLLIKSGDQSGFNLVQVDLLDAGYNITRTSYEVVDPSEDVIGRFGSLQEAQNFIKMLCLLNQQDLEQESSSIKSIEK